MTRTLSVAVLGGRRRPGRERPDPATHRGWVYDELRAGRVVPFSHATARACVALMDFYGMEIERAPSGGYRLVEEDGGCAVE